MGGRGWRVAVRNPGASFAPLSPAPATRSIKSPMTEHWRGSFYWRLFSRCGPFVQHGLNSSRVEIAGNIVILILLQIGNGQIV
jgi:hypothetical protein